MEKKKLSTQAMGALLMALQKCLAEQVDITGLLQEMDFVDSDDGLVVLNPPVVRVISVPVPEKKACCGQCQK